MCSAQLSKTSKISNCKSHLLLLYTLIVAGFCFGQTSSQFNGKPLMGWNSWDSYGMYPTQQAMFANLDVMAKRLKPYGYEYFVIDAGWNKVKDDNGKMIGMSVNENSLYVANPKTFPDGIKAVANRAHQLGLKFGIHIMRGISREAYKNNTAIIGTNYRARDIADTTSLCRWNSDNYGVDMKKPGAQEYYNSYIKQLADWGVDFIKADDITAHPEEIEAVEKAIKKTGKPIVLSLSPGGDSKTEYISTYNGAQMVRITKDVWDNKEGISRAFTAWKNWSDVQGRNFLLDMDMIPFGHLCLQNPDPNYRNAVQDPKKTGAGQREHMSFFSTDQKYTFMAIRALTASPMFMGGDLPTTDEFSFQLITDKDMLACNQNGITGKLVYQDGNVEVWKVVNRKHPDEGWFGVFNRTDDVKQVQLTPGNLGFNSGAVSLYNIWKKKNLNDMSPQQPLSESIPANGVLFCRYKLRANNSL